MINSWQTITRGSCVSKAWKPPSSRPILIYFEFRRKPSLITVICMDPHSPNKLFATKYCFLILGDEFLFLNHLFIYLFIFCYFVIINFYKNDVIMLFVDIFLFNLYITANKDSTLLMTVKLNRWHLLTEVESRCLQQKSAGFCEHTLGLYWFNRRRDKRRQCTILQPR